MSGVRGKCVPCGWPSDTAPTCPLPTCPHKPAVEGVIKYEAMRSLVHSWEKTAYKAPHEGYEAQMNCARELAAIPDARETARERLLAALVDEACDKGEALAADWHAREARLLALVKDWQEWEKIERNRGCGNFAEIYRMCAVELEAALRGDA